MNRLVRSPLMLMALTVFIDIAGFGLILPLLPFWAERLGANPVGVGMIVTAYALAQFLFTPILGSLSDRFGRRTIILASLLIEAVGFALTALAGSLPLLLAARFVGGIGASNIGSAQAVVADVTPPEGRARGMGLVGAAIGLGFVVGPAIGGALSGLGTTVPFWAACGVALVNALLVLRFLPETHKRATETTPLASASATRAGGWRQALRSGVVVRLLVINLVFTVAFTAMETVFPLFTQREYGWGVLQNGYIFTYVGLVIVFMQGGLVGRLVKMWGEHTVLIGGLALLAIGLAVLPFGTQLGILLLALGILSIGEGAVTPTSSALLSLSSPVEAQGRVLGFSQGLAGLGRIVGPLAAGAIFATYGVGAPFVVGGALVAVAFVIALPQLSRPRRESADTAASTNDAAPTEEPHAVEMR